MDGYGHLWTGMDIQWTKLGVQFVHYVRVG